jgi:hypothetical protein
MDEREGLVHTDEVRFFCRLHIKMPTRRNGLMALIRQSYGNNLAVSRMKRGNALLREARLTRGNALFRQAGVSRRPTPKARSPTPKARSPTPKASKTPNSNYKTPTGRNNSTRRWSPVNTTSSYHTYGPPIHPHRRKSPARTSSPNNVFYNAKESLTRAKKKRGAGPGLMKRLFIASLASQGMRGTAAPRNHHQRRGPNIHLIQNGFMPSHHGTHLR